MSKLQSTIQIVETAYHGFTILKYLIQTSKFQSINEIRQSIKLGNIKINNVAEYSTSTRVSHRDQISIIINEYKLNTLKLTKLCTEEHSFCNNNLVEKVNYKVIYKFGGSSLQLICGIYSKMYNSIVNPVYEIDKACYGLVLLSMNKETCNYFDKLRITRKYKILCYGKLETDKSNNQYEYKLIDILHYKYYQSTNLIWLSCFNLETSDPKLYGSRIRILLHELGHPIVGNSNYTYSLKSNKSMTLLLSLTSLLFLHQDKIQYEEFYKEEPAKFKIILNEISRVGQKKYDCSYHDDLTEIDSRTLLEIENGLPIAYALQYKVFCGYKFILNPTVMIPRKSTETLVNAVMAIYDQDSLFQDLNQNYRILDLGCGSGCIILSILKQLPSNFTGIAIDISKDALDVARRNTLELDVDNIEFHQTDFMTEELDFSEIDIIVCNPPYLDTKILIQPQFHYLNYEPKVALFSSTSMQYYERIAQFKSKMNNNSYMVLETGAKSSQYVIELFVSNGWIHHRSVYDSTGFNRCQIFK